MNWAGRNCFRNEFWKPVSKIYSTRFNTSSLHCPDSSCTCFCNAVDRHSLVLAMFEPLHSTSCEWCLGVVNELVYHLALSMIFFLIFSSVDRKRHATDKIETISATFFSHLLRVSFVKSLLRQVVVRDAKNECVQRERVSWRTETCGRCNFSKFESCFAFVNYYSKHSSNKNISCAQWVSWRDREVCMRVRL